MKNWLRYWQGRIRLWWGFCPKCNSDAPELYSCEICDGYCSSSSPFYEWPIHPLTKRRWKNRWGLTHQFHLNILNEK